MLQHIFLINCRQFQFYKTNELVWIRTVVYDVAMAMAIVKKLKKNSLQFWVRFGLFLNFLASSCSLVLIFFNSKWSSLSTPGNQWSFQLLSPVSLSKHHFIVYSLFCVIRFTLPVYDVYNWMKAGLVAFSWNLFYLTPTRRSNWNACNMLLHFI